MQQIEASSRQLSCCYHSPILSKRSVLFCLNQQHASLASSSKTLLLLITPATPAESTLDHKETTIHLKVEGFAKFGSHCGHAFCTF